MWLKSNGTTNITTCYNLGNNLKTFFAVIEKGANSQNLYKANKIKGPYISFINSKYHKPVLVNKDNFFTSSNKMSVVAVKLRVPDDDAVGSVSLFSSRFFLDGFSYRYKIKPHYLKYKIKAL